MKYLRIFLLILIPFFILMTTCERNNKKEKCQSPEIVVKEYYTLLEKGETAKAAEKFSHNGHNLTPEELIKMKEVLEWKVNALKEKNGIRDLIIIEETFVGDDKSARVKYNIVFNNGTEEDRKQSLEKIEGRWYLKY